MWSRVSTGDLAAVESSRGRASRQAVAIVNQANLEKHGMSRYGALNGNFLMWRLSLLIMVMKQQGFILHDKDWSNSLPSFMMMKQQFHIAASWSSRRREHNRRWELH
ncbi:hypothetical protein Dimus_037058, partial [Dionaea muscipula]